MTNLLRVKGNRAQLFTIRDIEDLAFVRYTATVHSDGDLEVIVCAEDDDLPAITAAGCTYEILIPSADYENHIENLDVDPNPSV